MANLQPDSSRKREKNQINKIRNEKGEITTDNAEIQRIIRDYYEQLYGKKIDNLEETDRFLEKFSLPRLNQEMEAVIKNPPKNKSPGPDGFIGEFYQTFTEDQRPTKTLSKNCRVRNPSKRIL